MALTGSYLSNRYVERAFATYQRQQPAALLNDLEERRELNPLRVDPIMAEGTISLYLAQPARARAAFAPRHSASERLVCLLEMALLDAEEGLLRDGLQRGGRRGGARFHDPLIAAARTMIQHRQRMDPDLVFNRRFVVGPQAILFKKQNVK